MNDQEKELAKVDEEKVTGGTAPWDGLKPQYNGATCPECGFCKVTFERFQEYQGWIEEVCECSYCGPITFKVKKV